MELVVNGEKRSIDVKSPSSVQIVGDACAEAGLLDEDVGMCIVSVNGDVYPSDEFDNVIVYDYDELDFLPLMAGG